MSTTERELQVLHEIECALRHDDRFLPARFAFLRPRAALHRRKMRVLLAVEAAMFVLLTVAALLGSQVLLLTAIGAALSVPPIAFSWRCTHP